MRGKFLSAAMLAAIVGVFPVAPHAAQARGETVSVKERFVPGTTLVRTSERRLYYFTSNGRAIRYPVGVGRAGKQWSGTSHIEGKYIRPDWAPPELRLSRASTSPSLAMTSVCFHLNSSFP
jgi:lipoprotein-anchoring transpeptidase ErfK/SrfK